MEVAVLIRQVTVHYGTVPAATLLQWSSRLEARFRVTDVPGRMAEEGERTWLLWRR